VQLLVLVSQQYVEELAPPAGDDEALGTVTVPSLVSVRLAGCCVLTKMAYPVRNRTPRSPRMGTGCRSGMKERMRMPGRTESLVFACSTA